MTKGNGSIGSITTLMRDFSFTKDIIESVIRTTEIECPHENADMKYDHAWRKFWTLIG